MTSTTSKIFLAVLLLTCVSRAQAQCEAYDNIDLIILNEPTNRHCYWRCIGEYKCFFYQYHEGGTCYLFVSDGDVVNLDENVYHDSTIACIYRSRCDAYSEDFNFPVQANNHMECFMTCLHKKRCWSYVYDPSDVSCLLRTKGGRSSDIDYTYGHDFYSHVVCNL
ncbi:uncharacterized protein LOC131936962 [Physella acuta]|uniref:uncharacterized protein LOC131936962 n=1 Tax=Physella acuta TaxID=109671 RepID=UPI0027DDA647|nr:uncharacterized protein LOC131936962 [Physella acuta]